jgi:hypothetical protein
MTAEPLSVTRFTSIGRTLDPRTPTNALIMGLTALGGLISGALALLQGGDFGAAAVAGFWTGAAVFIAWVLTREIDPDYPYSAFLSAGLALVASLLLGAPALTLLVLIAIIITLRLITRVVGPPFHWFDSIVLLAVALLLAWSGHGLSAILVGVAFALDGLMLPPLRRHLVFAVLAIGAGVLALIADPVAVARPDGAASNVLFVIVLAFGFLLITTQHITSPCDVPGYTLSAARVQAAMVWLLAVAVILGFTEGVAALTGFLPIWAALAGAAVYRAGELALKRARPRG